MNFTVLKAIFKRDFTSYFASATGWVFICVFVVLSSLAAFWPDEFFSNGLANLDQLSKWMPFILLVFVPAITMSSWAEERRRGTDELLLTLPATDSDVVIGKYLASVAIFTVSLLFSMASVLLIFAYGLGDPDPLLFCCTYLGYWLVGLAMLATGMVASFLTSNLTVGFILGMLFCAPQALASFVDNALGYLAAIPWLKEVAQADWFRELSRGVVSSFSAFEGFSDFSRGVVSLGGALHFLCIVVLMLYLCMVLIGKRHWAGGDDGQSLWWHYIVRGLALFFIVGGVNTILRYHDIVRLDMTTDRINSLATRTVDLVEDLGDDKDLPPIKIDAYVSPQVPAEYATQKRELLSVLDELRSISGGKVVVTKHEIENFSEEATRAESTYGIEARTVSTRVRGALEEAEIFLGAAVSCGLDKVVIPFLDKGIPVEYELVRSIVTVADPERKRVGVIKTDAPLFSSFTMQGPTSESQLIAELKKQYEVIEVDPTSPITDSYDVLIAVQPSGLSPDAFSNFVEAVKSGQPTAIFEDPLPVMWQGVVGTGEPKMQGGGMMGMFGGGQQVPKGDMQQLWNLLGARMDTSQIVWHAYNPYSNTPARPEWVFADIDAAPNAFSAESPITSGMRQTLMLYTGAIQKIDGAKTFLQPLIVTGELSGSLSTQTAQGYLRRMVDESQLQRSRRKTGNSYILAAQITGRPPEQTDVTLDESIDDAALRAEAEGAAEGETDGAADQPEEQPPINVVFVADIDCVGSQFFEIRAIGSDEDLLPDDWRFQNVTLVLNILDELAGDDRYLALRKRTRDYRTLSQIEDATADYRTKIQQDQEEFRNTAKDEIEAAQSRVQVEVQKIATDPSIPREQKPQRIERVQMREQRKAAVTVTRLQQELQRKLKQSDRDLQNYVSSIQDRYKFAAIVVPPIPPILLALWVYFRRRAMESEGVSKDRLRYASKTPATEPEAETAA